MGRFMESFLSFLRVVKEKYSELSKPAGLFVFLDEADLSIALKPCRGEVGNLVLLAECCSDPPAGRRVCAEIELEQRTMTNCHDSFECEGTWLEYPVTGQFLPPELR